MSSTDELWLPRPGEAIGRYEVIRQIAKGGMAAVYAVRLPSIGFDQTFAMKVVLPHLRGVDEFNEMFLDEARIAASVHHPNVVQVIEMGTHRGASFLVMEYLRGQSLSAIRKKLRSKSDLPLKATLQILAASARGLHAAHETRDNNGAFMRIVHRDVSPQNIFVGYDGVVKIVDFGVAAARGKLVETQTGQIKGKFQYLAPEQVRRTREPDRRTDIWALGVVAWELISGRPLFRGDDDASTLFNVVSQDVPSLPASTPDRLVQLVMRCLSREVSARPDDAEQVAQEFDGLAAQADGADVIALLNEWFPDERKADAEALQTPIDSKIVVGSEPPTVASPTAPTQRKSRAPFALIALVATLAIIGTAIAFGGSSAEPNPANAPVSTPVERVEEDVPVAETQAEPEPVERVEVEPQPDLVQPETMRSPMRRRPRVRMTETVATEMVDAPMEATMMRAATGFGNPYAM